MQIILNLFCRNQNMQLQKYNPWTYITETTTILLKRNYAGKFLQKFEQSIFTTKHQKGENEHRELMRIFRPIFTTKHSKKVEWTHREYSANWQKQGKLIPKSHRSFKTESKQQKLIQRRIESEVIPRLYS